jgi:hypothetical protein
MKPNQKFRHKFQLHVTATFVKMFDNGNYQLLVDEGKSKPTKHSYYPSDLQGEKACWVELVEQPLKAEFLLNTKSRPFLVNSIAEARNLSIRHIQQRDLGGSEFGGCLVWDSEGKPLAHISYNGRVWEWSGGLSWQDVGKKEIILSPDGSVVAQPAPTPEPTEVRQSEPDPLLEACLSLAKSEEGITVPLLQRRFRIGLIRARKLMTEIERETSSTTPTEPAQMEPAPTPEPEKPEVIFRIPSIGSYYKVEGEALFSVPMNADGTPEMEEGNTGKINWDECYPVSYSPEFEYANQEVYKALCLVYSPSVAHALVNKYIIRK